MRLGTRNSPITRAEIEDAIARLNDQLEATTEEYANLSERAATAEVDWKGAEAEYIVKGWASAEGERPPAEYARKAAALVEHSDKHRAYKVQSALLEACAERLRTYRTQSEHFRTLAANVRVQT